MCLGGGGGRGVGTEGDVRGTREVSLKGGKVNL